ncbi:hypothetical protein [Aquibacillus kalidii]|uniref:hypothetical protein n=1 Tax=Aquibacillus kalidii TaxID=2762597 RepID=UPI0016443516|nr:hypothetical protein [Aquibacillus kalidii]
MHWESLPSWVWFVYYLFLFATIALAITYIMKKKRRNLSIIAILFSISTPIIGILNSIGRARNVNEWEHMIIQFQQGAIWSIYVVLGFLYLLVYWGIMLIQNNKIAKQKGRLI